MDSRRFDDFVNFKKLVIFCELTLRYKYQNVVNFSFKPVKTIKFNDILQFNGYKFA